MSHSQLDEFAAILARDLGSPEDMIARTEWHEVRPRVRGRRWRYVEPGAGRRFLILPPS